jgi:hypothetical protein
MSPTLETVAVSSLRFDPENPRLPERYKRKPDDEVLKYLLLECNLIELMMSIGEKGYFAGEPLMVVPVSDGGRVVVEGNRRLGALKLLSSTDDPPVFPTQVRQVRETAKFRPQEVPVLSFSHRNEILSYLGYRHITGIKEWDAFAKARYVKQLRALHGEDNAAAHKALAKEIGSRANHVAKLLTGVSLMEKARDLGILEAMRIEEDDVPFSLLTTAIGYEEVAKFIGLSSTVDVEANGLKSLEFEELFRWLFDKSQRSFTVLGESRNLPKLARVVANERALAALRRGDSLETADLLTSGPLEAVRQNMDSAEKAIKAAQESLSIAEGLSSDEVEHSDRLRKGAVTLHSSIKGLVEAAADVQD